MFCVCAQCNPFLGGPRRTAWAGAALRARLDVPEAFGKSLRFCFRLGPEVSGPYPK